ncbi:MAG: hypothetical protein JWM68_5441 [Verrucomicrobiales bacterium]|nr:hypothetical protein [Verrucomicrobiales bacterium]
MPALWLSPAVKISVSLFPTRRFAIASLLALLIVGQLTVNAAAFGGMVVAWGNNTYGQTNVPVDLSGVTAIAAGGWHTVALKSDGTVLAWGRNDEGQTKVPAGLNGVTAISAGIEHTLALKSDGTVAAWGDNGYGQTNVPAGLSGVTAVAAGRFHTAALKSDGTVVAWGNNSYYQTNVPADLNEVIAIAAGAWHTVALKSDGTVVTWGLNNEGQTDIPAGLNDVLAIAAGGWNTVALKNDGTVVAWGNNAYGQTNVPADLNDLVAIASGVYHMVALKSDGTLVAWGDNFSGKATVPAGLSGVTAIAAGWDHTVAIVGSGAPVIMRAPSNQMVTVGAMANFKVAAIGTAVLSYQWLFNGSTLVGETTNGLALSNVQSNIVGNYTVVITNNFGSVTSSVAVLTVVSASSRVRAWGFNGFGETSVPGSLSGVTAIAAGNFHTLALKNDGTIVAWGNNIAGQTNIPVELTGVTAIAGGGHHSAALKNDGTVVAWGHNNEGETNVPSGLSGVTAIAAGGNHSVALQSDGTVVAWGYNGYGQTTVPADLNEVMAIAAGLYHTVALKNDGTVVSWGENGHGQTNVPAGLSGVAAIAAGGFHTVALKSDGTVVAWGDNQYGQTTVPDGLSGVTAIAAGGWHTVALKSDGTVVAWGDNREGQTNVPVDVTGVTAIAAGWDHTVAIVGSGAPVIIRAPTNQTITAGATANFNVAAMGMPLLSYQWRFNGSNLTGETTNSLIFSNIQSINAGNYTVVITNNFGSVTSSVAMLTVVDMQKPMVTITNLTLDQRISNQVFTVRGLASDNGQVTNVFYSLNGAAFQSAVGTTNWFATTLLTPGTNWIVVKSVDDFGLESLSVTGRCFFVVNRTLTLVTNGLGTIARDFSSLDLEVGRDYSVTAVPNTNQRFSYWQSNGVIVSNSETFHFLMQSNLVLQANFFPNSFLPLRGNYNGLFYDTNNLTQTSSGYFSLKVFTNGTFTGQILLDGGTNNFKGKFDLSGVAQLSVPRRGKGTLTVDLQFDLTNGTQKIIGTVAATNFVSELTALRAIFNQSHPATGSAGDYVIVMSGSTNSAATAPTGYSYARCKVGSDGSVTLNGSLSDGSAWQCSGPLLAGGMWPLYAPLYKGHGSISAWITFGSGNAYIYPPHPFWFKNPVSTGNLYRNGFTLTGPELVTSGNMRVAPVKGEHYLGFTNGVISLSDGNLPATIENDIVVNSNNVVSVISGTNRLAVSLTVTNGFFNGRFVHPATHATVLIRGGLVPADHLGLGYFLGTNQSGAVLIEAR